MDIETHNLLADLALWSGFDPASKREQFEAAATHGYSDEAIEVFTHIDGTAADTRDRLLMAVMRQHRIPYASARMSCTAGIATT